MRINRLEKEFRGRNRGRMTLSVLRAFSLTVFLWICHTSAFSQMGSYAAYSDSWVDDSAPANIVIVGSGVTQDHSNYYGHTYWVQTALASPSNRTSSATSYKTSSSDAYARVETSLALDWNDLGDYFTQSQHWMCCPYMGGNPANSPPPSQGCYPSGGTSSALKVGASHAYYAYASSVCSCCKYDIVPNCAIRCGPPTVTKAGNPGCANYVLRLQLWTEVAGFTTCILGSTQLIEALAADNCFDEVY